MLLCLVTVPDQAVVLDWVFADGPPKNASIYDNNKRRDFHAIVPMAVPDEHYWVEEELRIYHKLQEERRLKEEAVRVKVIILSIRFIRMVSYYWYFGYFPITCVVSWHRPRK